MSRPSSSASPRRVVITGMGCVTPLGHDPESLWRRLLAGESAVGPVTRYDASTFPTNFAAEVRDFDLAEHMGARAAEHAGAGLGTRFALAAASDAWEQAGLASRDLDPDRVVCCSCGEGFVAASKLATAFVGAEVASSPAAAFDAVPYSGNYVRVALGSFELSAAARAAWL